MGINIWKWVLRLLEGLIFLNWWYDKYCIILYFYMYYFWKKIYMGMILIVFLYIDDVYLFEFLGS